MARTLRVLIRSASTWRGPRHALLVLLGYSLLFTLFFAPVLFSSWQLAPGDGISYFLPNYYTKFVWWDDLVWGGFPAIADAPRMIWYPPNLLFSTVPHSWHLYVVSAFVLAASFTYGYIFRQTGVRLAAFVAGVTYGLSGFMIGHLGHVAMIHTAVWLPLLLWTLDELRGRLSGFWLAVGALAVACAGLAGHPQMFVYVLLTGGVYTLVTGWNARVRRASYYGAAGLIFALGVGLCAIQFLPTAELSALGLRASLTFEDFVAYSLPLKQVPLLLFPYAYGGAPGAFYGVPYFGAWVSGGGGWGVSELTGYVGLLPLMLAGVGFINRRRDTVAWLWLAIGFIALLLALGDAVPLGWLTFQVPLVNKFRAPARHLMEYSLAVSVLAGFGVAAIQKSATTSLTIRRVIVVAAILMFLALLSLWYLGNEINGRAQEVLGRGVALAPWRNAAIGLPLLVLLASGAALFVWHRRPAAFVRCALLLVVLVCDLATFGWFYEWHYGAPYDVFLRAPASAAPLGADLAASRQRLLPLRGGTGRVSEIPPNLSKLWNYPSASGYGPFILTRVSRLLTMPPHGSVPLSYLQTDNQGLDLMAVRYVLVAQQPDAPPASGDERGIRWTPEDLNVSLGAGCAPHPSYFKHSFEAPVAAEAVGIVSALACSVQLQQGAEMAQVRVTDEAGQAHALSLRVGRDSSEWAFDCPDVRPQMKHERAPVFRSYPATRGEVKCEAHDYVAQLQLPAGVKSIRSIEIEWTAGTAGTLTIKKLTLHDTRTGASHPLAPSSVALGDPTRWRQVAKLNFANSGYGAIKEEDAGDAIAYENLRARPRAWLTREVLQLTDAEALQAILTSRLPDGRSFDAGRTALVEGAVDFNAGVADESAKANVVRVDDGLMEVRTTSRVPAFLVTSDVFYPGWSASVDGHPASLVRADYALRGVAVPAGEHTVRFEFRPRRFYQGAAISAGTLLLLVATVWFASRRATPEGREREA